MPGEPDQGVRNASVLRAVGSKRSVSHTLGSTTACGLCLLRVRCPLASARVPSSPVTCSAQTMTFATDQRIASPGPASLVSLV